MTLHALGPQECIGRLGTQKIKIKRYEDADNFRIELCAGLFLKVSDRLLMAPGGPERTIVCQMLSPANRSG